jgi:hypothetical protein
VTEAQVREALEELLASTDLGAEDVEAEVETAIRSVHW